MVDFHSGNMVGRVDDYRQCLDIFNVQARLRVAESVAMTDPVAHLEAAMAVTRKITRKVDDLFAPLELEMKIMKWEPRFRSIMWEAVMLGAKQRLEDVNDGK